MRKTIEGFENRLSSQKHVELITLQTRRDKKKKSETALHYIKFDFIAPVIMKEKLDEGL